MRVAVFDITDGARSREHARGDPLVAFRFCPHRPVRHIAHADGTFEILVDGVQMLGETNGVPLLSARTITLIGMVASLASGLDLAIEC
jgi:hypothetical protein